MRKGYEGAADRALYHVQVHLHTSVPDSDREETICVCSVLQIIDEI